MTRGGNMYEEMTDLARGLSGVSVTKGADMKKDESDSDAVTVIASALETQLRASVQANDLKTLKEAMAIVKALDAVDARRDRAVAKCAAAQRKVWDAASPAASALLKSMERDPRD